MATQFITNQDKLLTTVVNNVLPSSDKLYFLVGYFYFSGFQELYKNIADKQVKILVGLQIETGLTNKILEFEVIDQTNTSRGKIREQFNKSFVTLFNDTDFFDSVERQEAFKIFLSKIKDGSLEIRKTVEPNHAKLYIFANKTEFNQGCEFPGSVITGSSNLTRAGLRDRFEINVISRDHATFDEALDIFTKLWDQSVVIADKNHLNIFFENVIEKIWYEKLPKPYLLYIRVLEEYFGIKKIDSLRLPSEITRNKFINLKYQLDAVERGIDIINRHNGVIIADVVGLGKSIIASALAHNLNLQTIVITPPHLIDQWEDYHNDFDYRARIFSTGKIEDALEYNNERDDEKLIIIDEAHKFRNELTSDYANLHQLCQKNKVVLLSATPFNNRPQDVFSMVKLFQIPTRTTIQSVDNLSFQFRELVKEYKDIKESQKKKKESQAVTSIRVKKVADQIRNILYPLVIRRSRLDLNVIEEYRDDLKQQKIAFPKVNDPELLEYDLNDLTELYESTLVTISPDDDAKGYIGARYMPSNYIKNFDTYKERIALEMGVDQNLLKQSQINLAQFMRRLLVRRFESSISAFKSTLESLIAHSQVICDWYEKLGKIPVYKKGKLPDVDSLIESAGEELEQELFDNAIEQQLEQHIEKGLWFIEKKEVSVNFIRDVKRDIEILEGIHKQWFGNGFPDDPKLRHFSEKIRKQLKNDPKRKIVVFTEFADTANYVYEQLKNKLKVFKYTSHDSNRQNKQVIKENFDAAAKTQANDYDVLIATDAISEGFNLHRAGTVFNYDIPYNPTRVIQRVGRINRINKKVFDELFIFNFFPTATGERETRVKQISTLKIAMVHALFGEDTKVLTKDEELQSFFAEQFNKEFAAQEEISPEAKYEDFIRGLRSSHPDIIEKALEMPKRSKIRRSKKKDSAGVILFGKKGQEFSFKLAADTKSSVTVGVANALALFEADPSENAKEVSEKFYPVYEFAKKKLFTKKTEVAIDKGKQDTILKLQKLKEILPDYKDYLEDLYYVAKELDALPDRYSKMIRAISVNKLKTEFADFFKEVPHNYLLGIMERESKIEEGKEVVILAEELI